MATAYVEIPLTQGYYTKIDADPEVYDRVAAHKWYAQVIRRRDGSIKNIYAQRGVRRGDGSRTAQMLHRLLVDAPDGMDVDHVNGDGLDNRRENLRAVTRQQNRQNARLHRHNTSGFAGVTWNKQIRKWKAQIQVDGCKRHLGYHPTAEDAARAYDAAARELGFKTFNFPRPGERSALTGEIVPLTSAGESAA